MEFLEKLRAKMERSECLYCDKTFRDYKTLREHMRKKLHKISYCIGDGTSAEGTSVRHLCYNFLIPWLKY